MSKKGTKSARSLGVRSAKPYIPETQKTDGLESHILYRRKHCRLRKQASISEQKHLSHFFILYIYICRGVPLYYAMENHIQWLDFTLCVNKML
jgi:hypothetical protein